MSYIVTFYGNRKHSDDTRHTGKIIQNMILRERDLHNSYSSWSIFKFVGVREALLVFCINGKRLRIASMLQCIWQGCAAKSYPDTYLSYNCLPRYFGLDGKESAHSVWDRVQSLGREDSLEKRMAIHSSILAWRIPWTEV